ncbi:MAG TPA: hypothetical protein VN956_23700 [Pyrinomonadaceae bacterium]|nr:hypothetical protein [Pyrinomonadaceae bacterium]
MPKPKPKNIPHMIIAESAANDLYFMLDGLMTGGSLLARQALEDIKEEGKEFEQKASGREFKNVIAGGLFRDNEKTERFLARVEALLKQEPRLMATADVFSKYLSDMRAFGQQSSTSLAEKSKVRATSNTASAQADDLIYYLLGLFSLVSTALISSEVSDPSRPRVDPTEDVARPKQLKQTRAKPQRGTIQRSRSRLLR